MYESNYVYILYILHMLLVSSFILWTADAQLIHKYLCPNSFQRQLKIVMQNLDYIITN